MGPAILFAVLQAAPGTLALPSDDTFTVEGRHLPLEACAGGPSETAHFLIGGERLTVAAAAVVRFTPQEISARGLIEDPDVLTLLVPPASGCPEAPLDLAVVTVAARDPSLPRGLMITAAAPQISGARMGALRDSGQCPPVDADFVGCPGSVEVEGRPVAITALIARSATGHDGGALFAICETPDGQPARCEVQGGRGQMTYKGLLAPGLPSVASLSSADALAGRLAQQPAP